MKFYVFNLIKNSHSHSNSPHSHHYSPHSHPYFSHSDLHSLHSLHSVPRFPIPALQIAEFVRSMFQSLFEDTTVTPNFLKIRICDKSCIKTDILFAIFNNKEFGNFKIRLSHGVLEGMNDG